MRPGATGSRSSTIAPRKCVRATLSTETAPPVCSASTSSAAALTSAQAAPSCAPPPRRRGAGRLGRRGAGRCRRCAPAGRCRPSCSSSLTGWAGGVQARGSGRGPALAGRPWGGKCMLTPQIEFGAADSSPGWSHTSRAAHSWQRSRRTSANPEPFAPTRLVISAGRRGSEPPRSRAAGGEGCSCPPEQQGRLQKHPATSRTPTTATRCSPGSCGNPLPGAERARRSRARGAGLTRFALLVTVTAHPDQLAEVAQQVDQLGRASRLRLRRCYGTQAAAFGAALGVGLVLPAHVTNTLAGTA